MAQIDGKYVKGIIGPIVFKKFRKKQVVQKRPEFRPGSHTVGSKKTAKTFGLASKLAMNLRERLINITTDFTDGEMVNRLNSEVIHILNQSLSTETGAFSFNSQSFSRLNGFEFNQKSMVRNSFHAHPETVFTENQLRIKIPELQLPQDFIFPKEIGLCLLSFGLGLFDLKNGRSSFLPIESREVEYEYKPGTYPAQTIDFQIEPGCLCIAVISLQFLRNTFAGKMFYNSTDFNPVAILNASIAAGESAHERTKNWKNMEVSL